MRSVKKTWREVAEARREAIQLNTLTPRPAVASRVGVVIATLPKLDGSVNLRIAHRLRGEWLTGWYPSKGDIPVLSGSSRERVLQMHAAGNVLDNVRQIGKGFSGSIGADPEIFMAREDGQVLPAWEFLPAKGEGNTCFWDGFQAEFTTETEACLAWFIDHVRTGLHRVHIAAQPKAGKFLLADVVEVREEVLEKAEEDQVRFGCDPSKNAYGDFGKLDADARKLTLRFAGGHKHFGCGELDEIEAQDIVKALDAIWGVVSVSMFEGLEHPMRRMYYGKAGEYRLPKHGLEYRTPSNAWLCHPAIAQISWTIARQAFAIGQQELLHVWKADQTEVRRVINELDVAGARKILKQNYRVLEMLLKAYYGSNQTRLSTPEFKRLSPLAIKHGLNVIMSGAINFLETPRDIVRNWMLDAPTDRDKWLNPTAEQREENRWLLHSESSNKQWLLAAEEIEQGMRI